MQYFFTMLGIYVMPSKDTYSLACPLAVGGVEKQEGASGSQRLFQTKTINVRPPHAVAL